MFLVSAVACANETVSSDPPTATPESPSPERTVPSDPPTATPGSSSPEQTAPSDSPTATPESPSPEQTAPSDPPTATPGSSSPEQTVASDPSTATPGSSVSTDVCESTLAALNTELAGPTATPVPHSHGDPAWRIPASIELQIFRSTRIVEATLSSVTATTETIDNGPGVACTYRAIHELRFTVLEDLLGSGSKNVLVVVREKHAYLTRGDVGSMGADAQGNANWRMQDRITTWDDRRAILFLRNLSKPYTSSSATAISGEDAMDFNRDNYHQTVWDYSIDTVSRAWLPAEEPIDGSNEVEPADPTARFITDLSVSPHETITKSELITCVTRLNLGLPWTQWNLPESCTRFGGD